MALSSEIHSYVYIKTELGNLGWVVSNPTRNPNGEVFTQNECRQDDYIKERLDLDKPEHVIVVKRHPRKYLVIEAKPEHKDLDRAISEAKEYARKLNRDEVVCPLITAVAGNDEDTYIIKSFYLANNEWVEIEINDKPVTGLISKENANKLIDADTAHIKDFQIPDELYLDKATKINQILHEGAINKNQRARVMAAMLLALAEGKRINTDNNAFALINEINSKVQEVLHNHNKGEYAKYIEISTPPTPENHIKFRRAILDTLQELEGINIRSAMNSGTDVLGRFYEKFLKYGNGAKEIGIVLTPRHVTKLAVEALGVTYLDRVLDPACGTGGFLVAAFDHVRKQADDWQLEKFKTEGLYGIEQDQEVVALALVNMIFRGDGKNNIVEGNCFTSNKFQNIHMSRVLMNPPFALKKEDEKEYKFVDLALSKMEKDGLLFVILPSPIMLRPKKYKVWRQHLLEKHTLRAVIKLPEDLFYPVSVHTSAVIIQAYRPHKQEDLVLWGWLNDGFIKRKGVMVHSGSETENSALILDKIQTHLFRQVDDSKPKQWKVMPINWDSDLECSPEAYLDDTDISKEDITREMESVIFNAVSSQMNVL